MSADRRNEAEMLMRLQGMLGADSVIAERAAMAKYLVDWRSRYHGDALCVVLPRSVKEVAATVAFCNETGTSIVPQGGNTSLRGNATPMGRGVVLSLERLNTVRKVDLKTNAITVEAGCTLEGVQKAAAAADRLFPLVIGSQGSCQIGGAIATNAGGNTVMRYGTMRDLLLGLEVVLPDGRIWNGLKALRKVSAGYDLKHLFVSSEGTLGIITAAVLKLFPKPKTIVTAWVALDDLQKAVRLLTLLREQFQERVSSYELISRSQLDITYRHVPRSRDPIGGSYPWGAIIEVTEATENENLRGAVEAALAGALEKGLARDCVIASSQKQSADIWFVREALSEANVKEGRHVSHDTIVPIASLPDFVSIATERVLKDFPDAEMIAGGHVGDGNIHLGFMFPHARFPTRESYEKTAAAINKVIFEVTESLDGGFCAEHGIGITYREAMKRYTDPVALELMQAIKAAFDPNKIMNPGKVF